MGESWNHDTKWKKPIMNDHIFFQMSRIGKYAEAESRLLCLLGLGGYAWCGRNEERLLMGSGFLSGSEEAVLKLFIVMVAQLLGYFKNYWTAYFK